jgi:ribosome maturation factor RimP
MVDKVSLTQLIKPAVEAAGMEFWGIEFIPGRRSMLRIYIDHADGVDVEDCALVSHQVAGVMDVHDPIKAAYRLEVSSPGWDRPLFTAEQYPRFVGETIKLRLMIPNNGRRNFIGKLLSTDAESISLELDDGSTVQLRFSHIEKANIAPDVEAQMKLKRE